MNSKHKETDLGGSLGLQQEVRREAVGQTGRDCEHKQTSLTSSLGVEQSSTYESQTEKQVNVCKASDLPLLKQHVPMSI